MKAFWFEQKPECNSQRAFVGELANVGEQSGGTRFTENLLEPDLMVLYTEVAIVLPLEMDSVIRRYRFLV